MYIGKQRPCNENSVAFMMHTAAWQLAESTLHACFESWLSVHFWVKQDSEWNLVHTAQHNMKEVHENTQHNLKELHEKVKGSGTCCINQW